MKKYLLLFLFSCKIIILTAQITTPVIKANFGVDAELRANFFNGIVQPASDDWFKFENTGTGQYMIDTTGAGNIVANYMSNPATRKTSFSRLMHPPFYSYVNKRLVIDAIFHRDFHGDDSTVFASGSNKNGMSPVSWSCPVAQSIPDKNDILDAFTHIRRAGTSVTDSMWMFGGISIENTNGNRYFDFELYQSDIHYNRTTRTFGGYGPDAGHTSWKFDAGGNVISAGDIIFSAEYSSSSLSFIQARIWINKSALSVNPLNFNWGGQFDGDGSGATYGYASIVPKTAGDFYTGMQSPLGTWAGPFSLVQQNNNVVTNYLPGQFMEFSVNLTKLGVDPGSYSNNPCGTPFRRVLIKTRASTSFTAELKDFIAPFRMFDFPPVDAFTNLLYYCRVMPEVPIAVINPNPASTYTWSTPNGNIVGTNTGTNIIVDKPGTYFVTQQLNTTCPLYAKDSVIIIFDSSCRIMDIDLTNFNVVRTNGIAQFKWQVNNNREAANYDVEYSFNGNDYSSLGTVTASNNDNFSDYSVSFPFAQNNATAVYFRIKINGKDSRIKYSNTILLKNEKMDKHDMSVFPNPSYGDLWFSVNSKVNETAEVFIYNTQGKLINNTKVNIVAGDNLLKLPGLTHSAAGMYLVKVKMLDGSVTQKVLKLK